MWVGGHSRSLKVVPFESSGTVSYSPSIVTMAVSVSISEIFNILTLKFGSAGVVQGHWKRRGFIDHVWLSMGSPNLVPFSSYLTLNNIVTLKSDLEVTQSHWNWCHSNAWMRFVRYSVSMNGVTLETRLGVVQGHWKWRRSIDHVWL